jgi:hypothetical protein
MIETVAYILEYYGRKREIYDRETNQLYLTRYYLFLKERKKFPFNVFLHKFHKSDDPILHDHPWNYITIIVKGGYWEWVPEYDIANNIVGERKIWRGRGHIRRCTAETYHRIELEPDVDCWTIFIPGIQRRQWGFLQHDDFWSNQKWIDHDQYIVARSR